MRLILDTHALLWWPDDDAALSRTAHDAVQDPENEIFVSAPSAVEVVTKHRWGKLPLAALLAQDFEFVVRGEGFMPLSISVRHASLAGGLGTAHKDPFDRFLIAQSLVEDLPLVSNEELFDTIGVTRLW